MTRNVLTGPAPQTSTAICCRCGRVTGAPVAVRWIQSDSGPGVVLYSCPECAPQLVLGPTPGDVIRTP